MQDNATTVSFREALDAGLITTYESASDEQAAQVKAMLRELADMDIASVTEGTNDVRAFIISFMGDGYDITIARRTS